MLDGVKGDFKNDWQFRQRNTRMPHMAKSTSPAVDQLKEVEKHIQGKLDEAAKAMKQGDTNAARKAISADSDLTVLRRIIKRVESNHYDLA